MDSESFRQYGKEMIDYVADYWDSLKIDANSCVEGEGRKPLSNVKPGYIWDLIPNKAPIEPESWENIFSDIEPVVLNANTNWHHPNFYAYYPTACSYPAILGDILSSGIASIGFTWNSSPSMTELEMAMMDWLGRAVGLPESFMNSDPGLGAGIIQNTASDATFIAILSARGRAVNRIKTEKENSENESWIQSTLNKTIDKFNLKNIVLQRLFSSNFFTSQNFESTNNTNEIVLNDVITFRNHDSSIFQKFIAYTSEQAHSSVEKNIMLSGVQMRKLKINKSNNGNYSIDSNGFEAAIKKDRENGLIPFILIATIGTTNTCGADCLNLLGPICEREKIWLHVDAAYAGSFLICDEYRYLANGIEYVDSFNFNAHKALMINFDCSPLWFKNATEAVDYFKVDPLYLKHAHQKNVFDYRHLQIALGRRFRSLKIWFVLRAIGIPQIQLYLKNQVKLAKYFANLITNDDRFELFVPQSLGLVCFRLKGENELNKKLNDEINKNGRIHLVPGSAEGIYFLRLAICSENTTEAHINAAFNITLECAANILQQQIN